MDSVAYLVMLGPVMLGVPKDQAVSHWLRNIRANPVVQLRNSGGALTGTARELSEPAELAAARRAYTRTVNAFDSWENTGSIPPNGPRPTRFSAYTNTGLIPESRSLSTFGTQVRTDARRTAVGADTYKNPF